MSGFYDNQALRYNGSTGSFISVFASGGGLGAPFGLTFGPDGMLYVCSGTTNEILRYNGTTGAFDKVFASGGGLYGPGYMAFATTPAPSPTPTPTPTTAVSVPVLSPAMQGFLALGLALFALLLMRRS